MKPESDIAACGLDCSTCDARIATITDDDGLREKTAALWREVHNAPNLKAEMINCTGCRQAGVKLGYCQICEIRNCANSKNYLTCSECSEVKTCAIVKKVHELVPEALENLLRNN